MFNRVLKYFNIDSAILYFISSKALALIYSPITILLITSKLTEVEQGYYFTFASLLGISIFFELGLGIILTHFASYEFSKLKWSDQGKLYGNSTSLEIIKTLIQKSLLWYLIAAILMSVIIIFLGIKIFSSKENVENINLYLPWLLLIIFFAINTALIPITSIIEGCGGVKNVQRLRFLQQALVIPFTWIAFILDGKLFVIFIEYLGYSFVLLWWIFTNYKSFILQMLSSNNLFSNSISWFKDIFPLQWKIALSWVSSYFLGYLFVPLLFHFSGEVIAGQMGLSLKITGYVYLFSMAWINTKIPKFGSLISSKKFSKLKRLFYQSIKSSLTASFLSSIALILLLLLLQFLEFEFSERLLTIDLLILLCFANILNVIFSSISGYLRSFKKEPMLYITLLLGITVSVSNYITTKFFNVDIMIYSYIIILIVIGLLGHIYVYKNNNAK